MVKAGRTFLCRLIELIELSEHVKYLHYKEKLNHLARGDIASWKNCIASHNGVTMFSQPWSAGECDHMFSDASDMALDVLYGDQWFCIPFIGDKRWCTQMSIAWQELYAAVKGVSTFAGIIYR